MSLAGYALIEACLAAGDRETFAARFLELAEWIRADQLMVFDFAR